jgi:hypothetical protein
MCPGRDRFGGPFARATSTALRSSLLTDFSDHHQMSGTNGEAEEQQPPRIYFSIVQRKVEIHPHSLRRWTKCFLGRASERSVFRC